MAQSTACSLGIALLESPQLGEKQFLFINACHCIKTCNLGFAHRVFHKATAELDNGLHINSHRLIT